MVLGTCLTSWEFVFSKTSYSKLEKLDLEAGILLFQVALRAAVALTF